MHLNLPKLAIDRPVFMSCVVLLLLILGILAYNTMAVDLFPDVSFPFVIVTTPYQGASPEEIETQVSKPLEDEFSTIQGVKKVTSTNEEGFSVVMIQFNMDADVKDSEQQVKDHLSFVRPTLPKDIDEPIVRRLDPSALPIAQLSLSSTLPPAQAYDLADQVIKPQLAQVEGVGVISIQGGRKREIQVQLDRNMLNRFRISASQVATRIGLNGMNVPVGKVQVGGRDLLFRSVGQYDDLDRLKQTSVNFMGSDVSVPVERLGHVVDTVEDAQGYSYINGQSTLVIQVVKQSKVNTVQVVDGLRKRIVRINESLKGQPGSPHLEMFQDMAWYIRMNLEDVKFTIFQGVILTILVVFLFLGSFRSTLITITALPVSLFGAFFLMNAVGFTLNMMTLLALSLAVGFLIDDAIVVRENIWRHIEEGAEPKKAAVEADPGSGAGRGGHLLGGHRGVHADRLPQRNGGPVLPAIWPDRLFRHGHLPFRGHGHGPHAFGLLGQEAGKGFQPDRHDGPLLRAVPQQVRPFPGHPAGRILGAHHLVPEAPVLDGPGGRFGFPGQSRVTAFHEDGFQACRRRGPVRGVPEGGTGHLPRIHAGQDLEDRGSGPPAPGGAAGGGHHRRF